MIMAMNIAAGKKQGNRSFYLALMCITLLAGTLRIYHLEKASFWVDELRTIRSCAASDTIPKSKILGYLPTLAGLWCSGVQISELSPDHPESWQSLGVTEFSSRIGSAVIGILSIPILGWASCRLFGNRAAVIFALLLALAPWHIYWSQASRFYTLQFLFYNLCLIFYYDATQNRSRLKIIVAMIFLVLAFLSQPPALVIVGIFALEWIIARYKHQPVRLGYWGWCSAIIALTICAAVMFWDFFHRPEKWTQFAGDLYQSPLKLILGTVFMVGPVIVLCSLLSGWWLLLTQRRLSTYLLLGALFPMVFFALLSVKSYVGLRYAFVTLYAWLALAALGCEMLYVQMSRFRAGRILGLAPAGMILCSMSLMLYGYYTSGVGFHARWRDAIHYVAEHRQPEDAIAISHPIMGKYYLQNPDVHDAPRYKEDIVSIKQRTWLIDEVADAVRGMVRRPWMSGKSEFKAYFDLRVIQPRSTVRVYLYDPNIDYSSTYLSQAGKKTVSDEKQTTTP